ncbi:MAG: M23 family metallopeptidase [Bacteroidota bacterium]|nr:M23 family metallopeptidase [Bacteroidota bacterium]
MKRKNLYITAVRIFFFAILSYSPVISSAQAVRKYPQNYFRWPLDIKPEIVANMGELRNNHWHMGLDVRTNQRENLPVYAAAAGYISKIRIEKFGFGRCIFITHPNGFTTLYGHLNNFFPALEEYVTRMQYSQETWAIELDFPKEKFPVTKGQFIAWSGSTGGSQGPHVHFEIRDTRTGVCLNPMLFGVPLKDNVRPSILKLAMYDRSGSIYEQVTQFFPLKNTGNGYILSKTPVIKTGSKRISFAIQAFDRLSGTNNENGIYSAQLFFDEKPVIDFTLDSIGYDRTRYLNAHIDYKYHANGGPFFQHLSQLPGEHSGVYHPMAGNGIIDLPDMDVHSVRIEVKDAYQNTSQLKFSVQYDNSLKKQEKFFSAAQKFLPGYVNVLEKPGFEMYLPETCLYDTLTSFYNRSNSTLVNSVSALHQVNDPSVPVQGELTVRIKPDKIISDPLREKIVIQRTYRSNHDVRKAEWNGEWMTAKFGDFGNFQAFTDTEPPVLNELGSGDTIDLSGSKRIVFQPGDNFDVIKNFRAELDGKWLRFTNDKGRLYIYIFDERCRYGLHELKVTVEDLVGNTTVKTWWFKKYAYKASSKKKAANKKSSKGKKKNTTKKKTTAKKK